MCAEAQQALSAGCFWEAASPRRGPPPRGCWVVWAMVVRHTGRTERRPPHTQGVAEVSTVIITTITAGRVGSAQAGHAAHTCTCCVPGSPHPSPAGSQHSPGPHPSPGAWGVQRVPAREHAPPTRASGRFGPGARRAGCGGGVWVLSAGSAHGPSDGACASSTSTVARDPAGWTSRAAGVRARPWGAPAQVLRLALPSSPPLLRSSLGTPSSSSRPTALLKGKEKTASTSLQQQRLHNAVKTSLTAV